MAVVAVGVIFGNKPFIRVLISVIASYGGRSYHRAFFYMRIELLRAKVGETRALSSINHFFSLTLSTIR